MAFSLPQLCTTRAPWSTSVKADGASIGGTAVCLVALQAGSAAVFKVSSDSQGRAVARQAHPDTQPVTGISISISIGRLQVRPLRPGTATARTFEHVSHARIGHARTGLVTIEATRRTVLQIGTDTGRVAIAGQRDRETEQVCRCGCCSTTMS